MGGQVLRAPQLKMSFLAPGGSCIPWYLAFPSSRDLGLAVAPALLSKPKMSPSLRGPVSQGPVHSSGSPDVPQNSSLLCRILFAVKSHMSPAPGSARMLETVTPLAWKSDSGRGRSFQGSLLACVIHPSGYEGTAFYLLSSAPPPPLGSVSLPGPASALGFPCGS